MFGSAATIYDEVEQELQEKLQKKKLNDERSAWYKISMIRMWGTFSVVRLMRSSIS